MALNVSTEQWRQQDNVLFLRLSDLPMTAVPSQNGNA